MNEKLEVKKSESIVKARYKLSPLAIKFISTIIANLKRSDTDNQEYIFKISDFKELTGQKTNRIYELIDKATQELLNNPLKIPRDDGGFLKANWVADVEYKKRMGVIGFTISHKLKPFLLETKEKYLKYNLENILPLKSRYAIRLYEILKDIYNMQSRYGNKVEEVIEVVKLKDMLEIPNSYQFKDIKRRILEKSKKELKELTDIKFGYTEIKTGRKISHIKFSIYANNKNEQHKPYLASLKSFIDFLKSLWAGNRKSFFYDRDPIKHQFVFFGIHKDGLLYSYSLAGHINTYNSLQSQELYIRFYKVFKQNKLWQNLLETQKDLTFIYKYNKELFDSMQEQIKSIQQENNKKDIEMMIGKAIKKM